MIPWYDKPPSRAQLRYLKNLGYIEPAPLSMAEASAAIAEMLLTADTAAAYRQILAERHERETLFDKFENHVGYRARHRSSKIVWLLAAPVVAIGNLAAALFWLTSRLIAFAGWTCSSLAAAFIWVLSSVGLLARRSAMMTAQVGREKVIPWIGAQDWRSMAAGCRAQVVASVHQVDGLLLHASGNDRFLLLILRFATAAGAAIAGVGIVLWVF